MDKPPHDHAAERLPSDDTTERLPYEAPVLIRLGTIEDLTGSVILSAANDGIVGLGNSGSIV